MRTLTVREVPDEVYAVLKLEAEATHRNLREQVRWVLAKEVRLRTGGFLDAARRWQCKLSRRALGGTVADIRAGRARR